MTKYVQRPSLLDSHNNTISDCAACDLFEECSKYRRMYNDIYLKQIAICSMVKDRCYIRSGGLYKSHVITAEQKEIGLIYRPMAPECHFCDISDICSFDREEYSKTEEYKCITECKAGMHYEKV